MLSLYKTILGIAIEIISSRAWEASGGLVTGVNP
jgi:hypothetical protein